MAEKIKQQHEAHESHEQLVSNEHQEKAEKGRHEAAEKAKQEQSEVNIAEIRELAAAEAKAAEETNVNEAESNDDSSTLIGLPGLLKTDAYKKTLKRVQQRLKPADRTLSKIVHNKTVESISNVGAQTMARPSGLLGGSICAFLGSLVLLYSAKHYGFRYNYFMFFIFFVGGFLVGLGIELLIWLVYTRKHRF